MDPSGYQNLTAAPYSSLMPQNQTRMLSKEERFSYQEDYLQKYQTAILNEVELDDLKRKRVISQTVGSAFAVLIPFTMIYTFSSKYDLSTYYPKMIRNLFLLGSAGLVWMKVKSDQRALHQRLIGKYLAEYTDADL